VVRADRWRIPRTDAPRAIGRLRHAERSERAGFDGAIYLFSTMGGEEGLTPAFETWLYEVADAQAAVYPAMACLGSMAALGVAWWARTRIVGEGDQGVGPLRQFRFNDHLVWLLVAGLLLVVAQWGEALARVPVHVVTVNEYLA